MFVYVLHRHCSYFDMSSFHRWKTILGTGRHLTRITVNHLASRIAFLHERIFKVLGGELEPKANRSKKLKINDSNISFTANPVKAISRELTKECSQFPLLNDSIMTSNVIRKTVS